MLSKIHLLHVLSTTIINKAFMISDIFQTFVDWNVCDETFVRVQKNHFRKSYICSSDNLISNMASGRYTRKAVIGFPKSTRPMFEYADDRVR